MKKCISAKRTHFENRIKSNCSRVISGGWQSITGLKTNPNVAKRTQVNPNFGLSPTSPMPPVPAAPGGRESNPVKPGQTSFPVQTGGEFRNPP